VDLWMRMDWRRGRSTILDEVGGTIEVNIALDVLESKVSILVEWLVRIGRTWGGVFEVLGTWDDKLSESLEKWSVRIRSNVVKLWVMDGMEKKGICTRKITWWDT